jgi:hypothetical protein
MAVLAGKLEARREDCAPVATGIHDWQTSLKESIETYDS